MIDAFIIRCQEVGISTDPDVFDLMSRSTLLKELGASYTTTYSILISNGYRLSLYQRMRETCELKSDSTSAS